jgi:hypothetical protein
VSAGVPAASARPLLRGALHGAAFVASLGVGAVFVAYSRESRVLPAAIFANELRLVCRSLLEARRAAASGPVIASV